MNFTGQSGVITGAAGGIGSAQTRRFLFITGQILNVDGGSTFH